MLLPRLVALLLPIAGRVWSGCAGAPGAGARPAPPIAEQWAELMVEVEHCDAGHAAAAREGKKTP